MPTSEYPPSSGESKESGDVSADRDSLVTFCAGMLDMENALDPPETADQQTEELQRHRRVMERLLQAIRERLDDTLTFETVLDLLRRDAELLKQMQPLVDQQRHGTLREWVRYLYRPRPHPGDLASTLLSVPHARRILDAFESVAQARRTFTEVESLYRLPIVGILAEMLIHACLQHGDDETP